MPVKRSTPVFLVLFAGLFLSPLVVRAEPAASKVFRATDTQRTWTDESQPAQAMLKNLAWRPAEFDVRCTATPGLEYDALVRFPSPWPSGERWVDEVVLMWYAARDEERNPIEAPAVLVVHSLHPQMVISKQIARIMSDQGLHVFIIQLPGYGLRWGGQRLYPGVMALRQGRQTIADSVRAYDAIAALPNIKPGPVALQGTSLGGFVAATVGGVEPRFQPVMLLISGADCYGTLMAGKHDAFNLKVALYESGHRGEALKRMLAYVEPLNVAHRLDPVSTYLLAARDDVTIPRASSDALAEAVGLDGKHYAHLQATHYTAVVMIQAIAENFAGIVKGRETASIQPADQDSR